jgi:hypothetical protein
MRAILAVLIGAGAAACAPRARPYRFAAPRVAGAELGAPDRAPARPDPRTPIADVPPAAALTPDTARSLAGARDHRDPLAFALDLRARLTGDRMGAPDGPALVELARARGLLDDPSAAIAPGALLVFDRAVARAPMSLVAVALATDERGVITMAYLAAGVVRIGYLDRAHPASKRDEHGRVRNTFLRHRDEEPPDGTHFLAGELLAHVIR